MASAFQPPSPLLARLSDRTVVGLATLGPLGRWGRAPGTNGSLAGLGLYLALFHWLPWPAQLALATVLAWGAARICGEAERRLQRHDPGMIILDEFVSQPLLFLGLASALQAVEQPWIFLLAGFGVFRLLDITKPFGIARLQNLPGGWGVVADDLGAGLLGCALMHLGAWIFVWWGLF